MTAKLQNLQAGWNSGYLLTPSLLRQWNWRRTNGGQSVSKFQIFTEQWHEGCFPKVPTVSVPASAACRSLVSAGSCYCLSWRTARRSWLLGELKRWVEWAPLSKRFLSFRLPQILGSAVQENVQTTLHDPLTQSGSGSSFTCPLWPLWPTAMVTTAHWPQRNLHSTASDSDSDSSTTWHMAWLGYRDFKLQVPNSKRPKALSIGVWSIPLHYLLGQP